MIGSTNLIGTSIGRYEIQALIGVGGMATVYRALDRSLQRPVALKLLSDAVAAQPGFADRFLQEARLLAGLRHPNIVQVYDFGEHDGHRYMVQELLPGPTLQQRLRDLEASGQRIERAEVLSIARQLAAALDAAHAAGIIHRDVKPANALWNAAGALVLTDFGIAKNTVAPASYTQTGMVVGTPHYLSPEQAQGLPPSPSSDIYSLGVVLYEVISGRLPFDRSTPLGVVMSHIQDPPPPLHPLRPDLPAAVDLVIQQALAKDPAGRFRSAGVLAQALERAWPVDALASLQHDPAIHAQPTRVWDSAARPPAQQPIPQAAPPIPQIAPPDIPPAPARRAGAPTLLLGALLLALLLGGGALLARKVLQLAEPPVAVATSAAAAPAPEPTAAPTSPPAPTSLPATRAPAPKPTSLPATRAPAPKPTLAPPKPAATPVPPDTNSSLDRLRALLAAGVADGRAGKAGDQLVKDLDSAREALADNNTKRATDRLRDLQRHIADARDDDRIDGAFANQLLAGVDDVARSYGLKLPPGKGGKG